MFGPSGCGKTAGFAIPALLEWEGPIIATSVKGDLLDATIAHRRTKGKVWVYDPERTSGDGTCSPWSPLPGLRRLGQRHAPRRLDGRGRPTDAGQRRGRQLLVLAGGQGPGAVPARRRARRPRPGRRRPVGRHPEPSPRPRRSSRATSGRSAARPGPRSRRTRRSTPAGTTSTRRSSASSGGCSLTAPDDRADLAELPYEQWPLDLVEDIASTVEAEWQAELANAAGDPGAPLAAGRALWEKEPKLARLGVRHHRDRPAVVVRAGGRRARPSRPARRRPRRLARRRQHDLRRLHRARAEAAPARAHRAHAAGDPPRVRRRQPLARRAPARSRASILLDEAGNIAPLPDLPAYVSTARSHGITLVTVWQDNAQITAIYGDRARTVLNNHRAKLYGTGTRRRDRPRLRQPPRRRAAPDAAQRLDRPARRSPLGQRAPHLPAGRPGRRHPPHRPERGRPHLRLRAARPRAAAPVVRRPPAPRHRRPA